MIPTARQNPEIVPPGFTDCDQLVFRVQIDHPVVTPDGRQPGQPRGRESDFQPGRCRPAQLTGHAQSLIHCPPFTLATIQDPDTTVGLKTVLRAGISHALFLEPVRELGNLVPAPEVSRQIEADDGLERFFSWAIGWAICRHRANRLNDQGGTKNSKKQVHGSRW